MKTILTILLFCSLYTQATTYYPATMGQINGYSLRAGDSVLFTSGITYTGSLNANVNGVYYGYRGTGVKSVLTLNNRENLLTVNATGCTFEGLNFTDLTDPGNEAKVLNAIILNGGSNTVRGCSFSLVAIGIFLNSSNNTVTGCNFTNLKMEKNTPGGDDDYGANPVVISGANNVIEKNTFNECWAVSFDYGFDGGAIEMYGQGTNNNIIRYNTAINCEGFMEIGSGDGGSSTGNIIAYNKIINCDKLLWISNSGNFAINVSNLQFYNNVIIHTINQYSQTDRLFGRSSNTGTSGMVVIKNNIFWLTQGMDMAQAGQWNSGQLTHESNVYKLAAGSVLNYTISASERLTTSPLFVSTTSLPNVWDYNSIAGSPAINLGQPVGIATDFIGSAILGLPDAGILEYLNVLAIEPTPMPQIMPGSFYQQGNIIYLKSRRFSGYKIFDALGRAALTGTLKVGSNTINISGLVVGIYFMKTDQKTYKIIK